MCCIVGGDQSGLDIIMIIIIFGIVVVIIIIIIIIITGYHFEQVMRLSGCFLWVGLMCIDSHLEASLHHFAS